MRSLHEEFQKTWESGQAEPLLLIPAYVLDFLCIHPFRDSNGRASFVRKPDNTLSGRWGFGEDAKAEGTWKMDFTKPKPAKPKGK